MKAGRQDTTTCADCGRELPSEARFCMYCGNVTENFDRLVNVPAPSEPVREPEPPEPLFEAQDSGLPRTSTVPSPPSNTRRRWFVSCLLLLCVLFIILSGGLIILQVTGRAPARLAGWIAPPSQPSLTPEHATSQDTPTTAPSSPTPLPTPSFTPAVTSTIPPSSTPTEPPTPTQLESSATPPVGGSTPQAPAGSSPYDLLFASNSEGGFRIYAMNSKDTADWIELQMPEGYENAYWPAFCQGRAAFEAHDFSQTLPRWIFWGEIPGGAIEPYEPPDETANRIGVPACSLDGRYMAFSARRGLDWFLDIADLTSGSLIFENSSQEYPMLGYSTWSDVADSFVWMGFRNSGYFDINRTGGFRTPGGDQTQLIAQGKYPALSPDGSRLAYFCGNLLSLCVVDLDSGETLFEETISYYVQIDGEQGQASATWSRDGEWIYFASSVSGNWDIYRIRPDGTGRQNMTQDWLSDEIMPAAR